MEVPFLDISRQHLRIEEEMDAAIREVRRRSRYVLGPESVSFEEEFARFLGVSDCIGCANGTDALELALEVLQIGNGDEVIVPAYGWPSATFAVRRMGANPVLADVDLESGNISLDEVEQRITTKTKAVIGIHLFGNPCDVLGLRRICDRHRLYLIEDCAQAHGASVGGVKVGGFGDLSTFSFYPTKNLGCLGDGGAVVTNNRAWAKETRRLRDYGRVEGDFTLENGRNSRLDEVQASILRVKLRHLGEWNEERLLTYKKYRSHEHVGKMLLRLEGVHYKLPMFSNRAAELGEYLHSAGIRTEYPGGQWPSRETETIYPNACRLQLGVLNLPMFIGITDKEIDFCCDMIDKFSRSTNRI